jgi:maleate isomerase
VVPANNSVLEPELWSRLPSGVALYATRVLARGDLTPEVVLRMEAQLDRAVDELAATGVNVLVYADMVTTFIMPEAWSEAKMAALTARLGVPCISAWMALAMALDTLAVRRFVLGTPYPRAIHVLARPFFERRGFSVTDDATLDVRATADVPRIPVERVRALAAGLDRRGSDATVLLATDLPTFDVIETLEAETEGAVLTSNQTLLWYALRRCGVADHVPGLGVLLTR